MVNAVGSSPSVTTSSVTSGDTGSGADIGGMGSAATINSMSADKFSAGLQNASNKDLTALATNAGINGDKRAAALETLIERLGSPAAPPQANGAAPPEEGGEEEDPAEKLKKLLQKMKEGKLTAEDQKELTKLISQMAGSQDTTKGGTTTADIK